MLSIGTEPARSTAPEESCHLPGFPLANAPTARPLADPRDVHYPYVGRRLEVPMDSPAMSHGDLPRYDRPNETIAPPASADAVLPWQQVRGVIEKSTLSPGSQALLIALLRCGTTRIFPGGGAGIEYGSLLKTAARPDEIGGHIQEAADHLRQRAVDVVLVPGMSGYPIGSMYALAAGLPALLLKKSRVSAAEAEQFPPGAFVIPSYTGEGDVVMSADPAAVADIVSTICERQLSLQADLATPVIHLRFAGADDIIDKAVMSRAVGDSAGVIGRLAVEHWLTGWRERTRDTRTVETRVTLSAWVTPLLKGYNHPQNHLQEWFGIRAFAGLTIDNLSVDPPAIGIAGLGMLGFARGST